MRQELDSLLASRDLDAILVCGPAQHNPDMVYLTGGGHLTRADLIKKRGEEAVATWVAVPIVFNLKTS